MKYKLFFILSITGIFFLSACSDFLKEQSQDEIIPQTTTDLRELLMGSGYPDNNEPTAFTYFLDDDVELYLAIAEFVEGSASTQYFPSYTWQSTFADVDGLGNPVGESAGSTAYYKIYERIKGCNAVLDYIDDAIGPQVEKDRVKAEALAVRALYYFKLVNLYGEPYNHNKEALGVPLKLTSTMTEAFMPRNTVAEVYDTIVSNLKTASALLEPLPIIRRSYHINQPAIHILLSRIYLFMENYAACMEEASKVMEKGGVLLNMTSGAGAASYYLKYENPEVEWMFGGRPQANQSPYIPAPEFRASFDQVNDARFRYGFSTITSFSVTPLVLKYISSSTETLQAMRTAEAYLNRAEANAQLGNSAAALSDLNELRRNRIVDYTDENISGKEALITAIRDERRKEFCYEGFRWFDLRRYGMPAITHRFQRESGEPVLVYTLAEKDPMYTLPFPNSLLLRNPALIQNPSAFLGERMGY
ncbi:membrane protein [Bacteroidia bacterium]|nr:membrane protein [Bacteroidia bacterium]